ALPETLRGSVDLAVAYLPHVPSNQLSHIARDFRAHEPTATLDGGADGLVHLRTILAGLGSWLSSSGAFLTLIADEQRVSAVRAAQANGLTAHTHGGDDVVLTVTR